MPAKYISKREAIEAAVERGADVQENRLTIQLCCIIGEKEDSFSG